MAAAGQEIVIQVICGRWAGHRETDGHGGLVQEIVKRIDMWALDMVFVVGGNGGNAGAAAIQAECEKAGVICSVIGVPKSIDNDILLVPPALQ